MKNFITLEGGECSGKTTIIESIIKKLEELNIDYITTREPGGIRIAEDIRNIILDVKNTEMTPECEALLYAASRMQHLSQKVIPAIEANKVVICDRFLDSSLVYQGYARGLGIDKVLTINSFALDYLPGLTLFIDVTPDVALKRMSGRNKADRLDLETMDFHQKVYEGYQLVYKKYPERIKRVDGNQELGKVINDCVKIVLDYLNK
ncbi:MAG: dTMP kinase [Acholeplasmatales bacterium]|nr:dTMP kinase [Acholeplasmatales bacterium]MBR6289683.1 dTMP kinase [Acholeplasmatales bacterium]